MQRTVARAWHHRWDVLLYSCYLDVRMSWDDLDDGSVSLQGSCSWHGDPCACPLPGSQWYLFLLQQSNLIPQSL